MTDVNTYLDPARDGAMATGWVQTGGTWYYLHGSGAMATNQWVEDRYWVTGSGAWTNTR